VAGWPVRTGVGVTLHPRPTGTAARSRRVGRTDVQRLHVKREGPGGRLGDALAAPPAGGRRTADGMVRRLPAAAIQPTKGDEYVQELVEARDRLATDSQAQNEEDA